MKNKKKIVLAYTADVSAVLVTGQVHYFQNNDYEVHIITHLGKDTEALISSEGGIAHNIPFEREISPIRDLRALFSVIAVLRKLQPEVVNAGTPKASLLVLIAAWWLGVPKRIYTCRGFRFETEHGFKKKLLKSLEKLSGKLAHRIICISQSLSDLAISEGVFNAHKVKVIGKGSSNGINLSKFTKANLDQNKLQRIKEELSLKEGCFIIGFAGRLHPDKGLNELFAAYDLLREKNLSVKLLLVGGLESDIIKQELKQRNEDKHLVYAGFQKDIAYYIANFDLLVLPSYREGFGNVLIQAAALGVPTIANNVTGCRDAVSDGFNGFLVPMKNPRALADKIHLIIKNPNLRVELGDNGIVFSKSFDNQKIWEGIDSLYLD